jgi:hypothetical protein
MFYKAYSVPALVPARSRRSTLSRFPFYIKALWFYGRFLLAFHVVFLATLAITTRFWYFVSLVSNA